MKFPYAMLLDFVHTDETPEAIGDLLTMAGFELEGIEEVEGDAVLDIKVCSNRGDGLSVLGLAREVLAKRPDAKPTELYLRAVNRFLAEDEERKSELDVPIHVQTPSCDRFAYRGFRSIVNGDAPERIAKRLRQAGQRPISLFVDLTNYVMLELGQPLHAYDLSKLHGPEIIVRQAAPGETMTTLNGVEHELKAEHMVIADKDRAIGIAGVMGGADTEVDENTTEVLLESAHFNNLSVRKTRKGLGLNTDASYRFERSVDPEGVVSALNRVRDLLIEFGYGAGCLPGVTDVRTQVAEKQVKRLRIAKANRLLGLDISHQEAERYLKNLGFEVKESVHSEHVMDDLATGSLIKALEFEVTVPSWRADISREEDLVEELGRVHGYEKIPAVLPEGRAEIGGVSGRFRVEEKLLEGSLKLGYDQVMTNSLRGHNPLDASDDKIAVRTPGSPDTASLRNSLLPGLAEAVRKNGPFNLQLVELGPIFLPPFSTKKALGLITQGHLYPPNRQTDVAPTADFFSLKAALENLAPLAGQTLSFTPSSADARFHPTRQATVASEAWKGVMGQLHPEITEALGLDPQTFAAELIIDGGEPEPKVAFTPVSRTPSIRRDIAFLIDKSVPYQKVEEAVRQALGKTLEALWLFDVYEGKGVPEGQHSLALALTLRKADATFTDEEANQEREKVVEALATLGAIRR
jgi:phenylalanyl-tRNA synthetase beta chain